MKRSKIICYARYSTLWQLTVSVGKGFGSKGKQHHKLTASETQSHNKWSHQMQSKSWNVSKSDQTRHYYQPDHQWPLSTLQCMAMKCCQLLKNLLTLTLKWDRIVLAIHFPLPGCMALPPNGLSKHGAGEAAADRSQGSHSEKTVVINNLSRTLWSD